MSVKYLTEEEWAATEAPLYFCTVGADYWTQIHRDLITKWIEAHLGGGWVYYDGKETYVFERPGDRLLFKMWIKEDPFKTGEGDIDF